MKYFIFLLFVCNILYSKCYFKLGYRHQTTQFATKRDFNPPAEKSNENLNGLVYTVELPRRAGINWGSDISFRWIYVLDLEKSGPADSLNGVIDKGDYIISFDNTSTIGQDFDFVLTSLSKQKPVLNFTFFRGTKEQVIHLYEIIFC